MPDADVPAGALALAERTAGAIRAELGAEIDAYPGAAGPDRADPLNRAFRAVVRCLMEADGTPPATLPALVSRTLRNASERRLAAEGWDERQTRLPIDMEPGGPDDWLAYLNLSSREQIEPLPGPGGPYGA
jgi:hypothetical protein